MKIELKKVKNIMKEIVGDKTVMKINTQRFFSEVVVEKLIQK